MTPSLTDAEKVVLKQLAILGPAVINDCAELLQLHESGLVSACQGVWTITPMGSALLSGGKPPMSDGQVPDVSTRVA